MVNTKSETVNFAVDIRVSISHQLNYTSLSIRYSYKHGALSHWSLAPFSFNKFFHRTSSDTAPIYHILSTIIYSFRKCHLEQKPQRPNPPSSRPQSYIFQSRSSQEAQAHLHTFKMWPRSEHKGPHEPAIIYRDLRGWKHLVKSPLGTLRSGKGFSNTLECRWRNDGLTIADEGPETGANQPR